MPRLQILVVSEDADFAADVAARAVALGHDVAGVVPCGEDVDRAVAAASPGALVLDGARMEPAMAVDQAGMLVRERSVPVLIVGGEDHRVPFEAATAEPFCFLASPLTERELRLGLELAIARHRAAKTVHELEAFFDVSQDMFCFLGFNGYFRRLNEAWERTLGYTREELMSRRFIEFVHPEDRERTLRQNAEVRAGGQARMFENRYLRKDGTHRWFLWNATPLVAEGVIYSVARDITESKRAEDERLRLMRQLEASLAEVRTLREILPICTYCRRIRDDQDYWQSVETYISRHTGARFSHGICPSCMATHVEPDLRGG